MSILKELKTSWPADYELQPNNATQRHNVIEIQSLKKRAAMEIEKLMAESQSHKADVERYRWIGENWGRFTILVNTLPPTEIQKVIDQALKEEKKNG